MKEKKQENINFKSISKVLLSSLIIVSFFYIMPLFINFAEKNFHVKEFKNNSKKILIYTLKSQDKAKKEIEILNEKDLLFFLESCVILINSCKETILFSLTTLDEILEYDDLISLKSVTEAPNFPTTKPAAKLAK